MAKRIVSLEEQQAIKEFESYHFASSGDYNLYQVNPKVLFSKTKNKGFNVDLLDHKGTKRKYLVQEVQNMMPGLAAKYPMIKTYRGISTKNPDHRISITVNDDVFIGRSHGHDENFYIQPIWNTTGLHAVSSVQNAEKNFAPPVCHVHDEGEMPKAGITQAKNQNSTNISLRTYRVAIAANGEYSAQNGGTVQSVLTSIVGHLNLINEIFHREVGINHLLVAENDQLIFLDSATDPYDNDEVSEMMTMNTGVINGIIGTEAYDFGHIFGRGGGGVANLAVPCGGRKGRGFSGLSGNADFYKLASHEIGHQFSAGHVWSFCTTALNTTQRSSASASEPGSGTTIMSYAGLCNAANVQGDDDPYYNALSVHQIKDFAFNGSGSFCSTDVPTANNEPEASLTYEDGFFIPISTPFKLTGSGSDMDGDALTYNWDQVDLDAAQPLGTIVGNSPAFRSMIPDSDPSRTFPRIADILSNNFTSRSEILPDYSRDLTFRFLVRDNNTEVGGTVWQELAFKTTDSAGPFSVDEPSGDYLAGISQAVKWDVANTDNPLVNCQKVNIILSYDGGNTFVDTLVKSTNNDGLEYVTFPAGTSTSARIKVEAADNIFFDISNQDFAIVDPTVADYSLTVDQTSFSLCSADQAMINIGSTPVLGFTESVTLAVTGGLPSGATATFGSNPVAPNGSTDLTISDFASATPGIYPVTVEATATGGSTQIFSINIKIVDANVSAPALAGPSDGQIRVPLAAITSWGTASGADSYNYQLATDAEFNNIVLDSSGIIIPNLTLNNLAANQLYFWRVRSTNQCANSPFSTPRTFYSKNQFCNTYARQQTLEIKEDVTGQVVSTINIDSTFTIQNFNIPYIRGTHDFVGDLEFILQSPAGGNRTLINGICDDSQNFDIGFDDEAVSLPNCPINDGSSYLPQQSLAAINGSNGDGLYILFVKDLKEGDGGEFIEWALEFCDDINPAKPNLLTNEQLVLKPATQKALSTTELEITDADTDNVDITFIVMAVPSLGDLKINGATATKGSTFTQADIAAGNVIYSNTSGANDATDGFDFVATDNAGGLIQQTTFDILLDANVAVIEILDGNNIALIPNPSNGDFIIRIENDNFLAKQVKIFNLQGQEVYRSNLNNNTSRNDIQINGSNLINGLYQISIFSEDAVVTRKIIVQK